MKVFTKADETSKIKPRVFWAWVNGGWDHVEELVYKHGDICEGWKMILDDKRSLWIVEGDAYSDEEDRPAV